MSIIKDLGLLIARLLLGTILIAHGWQKASDIGAAQAMFEGMDAPLPNISAIIAAAIELGGGIALILGLLTPLAGALVFLNMLGAALIAHVGNGILASDGGWELPGAIGACALALAVAGPGRIAADAFLFRSRSASAAA
ncbi:DoxX family protein [Corynebacterium lowii]|uniref:Putative oxidoreductase MhqP n=1 Tax=Corynebacterium lowii TaxID=1544413 RepID=A0A0Q1AK76_9CORY|nr:DoxX family protein [Corynebacterium lowii]KQB87343.1 putative oxidoreductase MhqP [Corynebacterium lowii]MDP9852068.1 putative oxidoreductase [Corynebacterium lowii]